MNKMHDPSKWIKYIQTSESEYKSYILEFRQTSGDIWKTTKAQQDLVCAAELSKMRTVKKYVLNGLKRPIFCRVKGQLTVLSLFPHTLSNDRHDPFTLPQLLDELTRRKKKVFYDCVNQTTDFCSIS